MYNEAMALVGELVVEGNINCIDATDGWVFASYYAEVPGRTSMEVGLIRAWNVPTSAMFDLRVRAARGAA